MSSNIDENEVGSRDFSNGFNEGLLIRYFTGKKVSIFGEPFLLPWHPISELCFAKAYGRRPTENSLGTFCVLSRFIDCLAYVCTYSSTKSVLDDKKVRSCR